MRGEVRRAGKMQRQDSGNLGGGGGGSAGTGDRSDSDEDSDDGEEDGVEASPIETVRLCLTGCICQLDSQLPHKIVNLLYTN